MSTTQPYEHMLQPLDLGYTQLRSRVIMGSMHTGLEEAHEGLEKMAEFFAARAKGGVGLIITGGFGTSARGVLGPGSAAVLTEQDADKHKIVTQRVHQEGGLIALQMLNAGRQAYHPQAIGASDIKSPIYPFPPHPLSTQEVDDEIEGFVNTAALAQYAGYDGVEVMGSEGYLINQFLATRANNRDDQWGGDYESRMRFPLEIVRRIRARVGPKFIISYRLSMLDLVPDGSTWDEVVALAKGVEAAGASIISTGIGWHEARIPTIATSVPRGAFSWVTGKLKKEVSIPVCSSNRINTPEVAEQIIAEGEADLVSMARPMLADPEFVNKARQGLRKQINICIGCNQACLDHTFMGRRSSCLVNPQACHETELVYTPTQHSKKIAVIGAGPAGLSFAVVAAERGHSVSLFDAGDKIGGQFNIAKQVPGKEEFQETLNYYQAQLDKFNIDVHLNTQVSAETLLNQHYDEIILATGITPRALDIPGIDHAKVLSYIDVILHKKPVGKKVAIIGAGGIGFDIAEYLAHGKINASLDKMAFMKEWGIDTTLQARGGISGIEPVIEPSTREISLLQRKTSKVGAGLGKTTGWIHRANLAKKGVHMVNGVEYKGVDEQGLHIVLNDEARCLDVDNIIICAGQEPQRALLAELQDAGASVHLVGGADKAMELDAKRAIDQAARLAAEI
ncbi:MAG: NADPH-dependent 2,4-dienoyl-CoA reductase [Gammaproteobacteria bacterium]|nr:MAG: NADPH-dependent 2,4-dienoyl-CoA reductase [Gammaproteobacteria bacterium]